MANIHFLKEGSGEGYAKRVHISPITEATEKLSKFSAQYSKTGPIINSDFPVSKNSSPKHVVLEVETGEENSRYSRTGYYIIAGLAPIDCAAMFGIYY